MKRKIYKTYFLQLVNQRKKYLNPVYFRITKDYTQSIHMELHLHRKFWNMTMLHRLSSHKSLRSKNLFSDRIHVEQFYQNT
jgi:hypothetical protein